MTFLLWGVHVLGVELIVFWGRWEGRGVDMLGDIFEMRAVYSALDYLVLYGCYVRLGCFGNGFLGVRNL